MEEEFIEAMESDDVLFCQNCDEQIEEESNYDWTFMDKESHEFVCPKCGIKYKVQISRPIEKLIFVLKEK